MIRRSALCAAALVFAAGIGTQALAEPVAQTAPDGTHTVCVMGGSSSGGYKDGICVWIPTK